MTKAITHIEQSAPGVFLVEIDGDDARTYEMIARDEAAAIKIALEADER